jgi:hypothetical protein
VPTCLGVRVTKAGCKRETRNATNVPKMSPKHRAWELHVETKSQTCTKIDITFIATFEMKGHAKTV